MASGYRILFTAITFSAIVTLALWYNEMRIHFGFKIAVAATLLLYLLIPFLYHFSVSVQTHLVFLPWVRWPHKVNFSDPASEGINGARNFYLETEPGVNVGVWHILPRSLIEKLRNQPSSFWEESMKISGKPVVLYLHGNTGSRAGGHRMELYVILQNLDCHILCLDYRGYADSTPLAPTETGVVTDARALYKYTRGVVKDVGKIFIWGHSLGTGVSSHMVADLCMEGDKPASLILESPFTSIGEEVKYHMLSAIYRYLPGFDYIFVSPLKENDIAFETDHHIQKIDIPIAILHAVDDPVIPFHLGLKLFHLAQRRRPTRAGPIYFKRFGEGYAHKFICRSPDLPGIVKQFIDCSVKNKWPCPGFDNAEFDLEEE